MSLDDKKLLPDGWSRSTLGQVAQYINGRAFKPSEWEDDGRPIIRIQNLTGSTKTINRYSGEIEDKYLIRDGDLLISWSATLGAFIYRGEEAVLNQHIFKVIPRINKKFLYYLVQSFLSDLQGKVHGSGMQHITKDKFESSIVPLPPHAEQERIVARIEELFTQLDAGVAALEAVRGQVRRYRKAVLRAAVEGNLSREWRNHKLNPNLIYYHGNDECTQESQTLPEGWCWSKVRQVGKVQLGRQRAPQHHNGPFMRPYLRVANVFEDHIDTSDILEMNFTPKEYDTYSLKHGDILLNEGQSPEFLGRPAIYRDEIPGACFQNTLIRFQASPALLPGFALIVFRHYMHSGRFQKLSQITTNIAHLSAGRFAEIEFPLPPISEQTVIINETERRLSITKQMEQTIHAVHHQEKRLRQSILSQAFLGKL